MNICCFHTGGPYADEADRLRASLVRLGLPHRIDEVPSRGSWDQNILIRPGYIRDVMSETSGTVLCVDADAEFHSVPTFDDGYDVQVHYLRDRELLNGTLWLGDSDVARDVVDQWCNEVRVGEWEQVTLQRILAERDDVKVKKLNASYCFIYDTSRRLYPGVEPIIEHHQASRRLKREVSNASNPA